MHLHFMTDVVKICLKKLNAIYRRAVKHLIFEPGLPTDEKLKKLKLLPLDKHLEYNKLILIHKTIHGKTPSYLTNLIQKSTIRLDTINLITPRARIDLYKTSLAFSGTKLWILSNLSNKRN